MNADNVKPPAPTLPGRAAQFPGADPFPAVTGYHRWQRAWLAAATDGDPLDPIAISFVIPLLNEEDNLRPLYAKLREVLNEIEQLCEVIFVEDGSFALLQQLHADDNRVRVVGGNARDGARRADFLPVNQRPFEGYEGIFNARLLGADRARILLACVQQEFWRQSTQARPTAGMTDDSAAPRPSR